MATILRHRAWLVFIANQTFGYVVETSFHWL